MSDKVSIENKPDDSVLLIEQINEDALNSCDNNTQLISSNSQTPISSSGANVPYAENHVTNEPNQSATPLTENYGWTNCVPNDTEGQNTIKDEAEDNVDQGLPSYIAATTRPSAPPLSPSLENENLISLDLSSSLAHKNENIVSNELEALRINIPLIDITPKIFKSELKKISIRVNLIEAAKRLLKFLREVDNQGNLYKGDIVKAAIYRYEHFWLPLLAKNSSGGKLSPPLDVHWVWIVHMLAPQYYEKDCIKIVEKIIPHQLMTPKALSRSRELGRALWEQNYPSEQWDLNDETDFENKYASTDSQISYKLEEAILRQSAFFYQVSMEHYKSKAFLCKAVYRYRQFLALKKAHPNRFLVPCYDMDIIWHSHQVHPVIYRDDTTQILGHLLPHDDSVNDRSEGSKLCVSDVDTRELWVKAFGTTFRREGAMFRGDPPPTYLKSVPPTVLESAHMSIFHVEVTKVKIQGNFPNGPLRIKLKQESQRLCDFTLFHSGPGTTEHNVTEMNLNFSIPEGGLRDWVVLKFSSEKKIGKLLKFLGKGYFWSMTNMEELFTIDQEGIVTKIFTDDESPSIVELEMKVRRDHICSWAPIGIMTGEFLPCILDPQTLVTLYGMVTNSRSENQDAYLAEMATHRLLNESSPSKPQIMEIEVYHSKHFMFSAIQLFVDCPIEGRSLVGLAHTLDLNTIPSPIGLKFGIGSQLEPRIATLNASAGERAMLIKTRGKDWALLVGRWQGLRKGVKGSFSARGVPGSPGYLVVNMYCPIGAPPVSITLPYEKQIYAFQLPDLFIDLEKGRLQINRDTDQFEEQIVLGLTITVLHVLCQPRAVVEDEIDGTDDTIPTITSSPAFDAPKRIPTERLKFLAALGFFCASAPTNSFITKKSRTEGGEVGGRYPGDGIGGFWPTYICDFSSTGVGACGSCGGCGGCGGGVFETIPPPSSVLWGSSNNNNDGGGGGDGGGEGEGGSSDWGGWGFDGGADGGSGGPSNVFDALLGGGTVDSGGTGGGGGCGGCGGGCGGCGG